MMRDTEMLSYVAQMQAIAVGRSTDRADELLCTVLRELSRDYIDKNYEIYKGARDLVELYRSMGVLRG